MDMVLQDRVAVITGAAMGMGLAVTKKFAAVGAKVVLVDINKEVADKAAEEINASQNTESGVFTGLSL